MIKAETSDVGNDEELLGMVDHTFNPSIWDAEPGGSLQLLGQPGLQSEPLSRNNSNKTTMQQKNK